MFGGTFSVSCVHKDLRAKHSKSLHFRNISFIYGTDYGTIQRVKIHFYSRAYERINAKSVL